MGSRISFILILLSTKVDAPGHSCAGIRERLRRTPPHPGSKSPLSSGSKSSQNWHVVNAQNFCSGAFGANDDVTYDASFVVLPTRDAIQIVCAWWALSVHMM